MQCKYLGQIDEYELKGKGRSAKICRDMNNECTKSRMKGLVSEFCWRMRE